MTDEKEGQAAGVTPGALGRGASWAATVWVIAVALLYLAVREVGLRVIE